MLASSRGYTSYIISRCASVDKYNYILRRTAMKKVLEIRAAEGGKDSKLFVNDLAITYEKTFQKLG